MLLLPPKRTGQAKPYQSIPRVNRDHPLAAGLQSFCLLNNAGDPNLAQGVNSFVPALLSGYTTPPTAFGTGIRLNASGGIVAALSGAKVLTKSSNAGAGTGDFTIAFIMIHNVDGGTDIIGQSEGASPDLGFKYSGGVFEMFTGGAVVTSSTAPTAGNIFVLIGTRIGTTMTLYINGVSAGTTTTSNAVYGGTSGWYFGGYNGGGDTVDCTGLCAAGWNRGLSQSEVTQWTLDPYGILIYSEDELFYFKPVAAAAALPSFGWYRREFEGIPPKPLFLESPPALGIRKLPTPAPVIWREHDNISFAKGRDDPGARGTSLTIPIANPIIPWREHDNVPFAKGRDDPGARGTSLTIPLAAPIIPRTSHDINPFAQGRDEPARWRIQVLPTPSPVLLAPHNFNPFPEGRSERPALGTALTIPTVPPVYNAPHDFNPFALGRSEPSAMGLSKLLITTLSPLVFWREHDNTPYAPGRSEPSSRVFQLAIPTYPTVYNAPHDFNPFAQGRSELSPRVFALTIPTVPPIYNAPHDFNPFALGRSEPPAVGWKSLPTPPPVLLAPHDFNPFAQGRSEPSPWRIPVLVTPVQIYNAPHDFNPFALGRSEPPAMGWPKLLVAVLAPIVFNAPAIHTAFVQGSSEPAANGWMILQQPVVIVTEFHALPFFDTVGSLKTM